MFNFLEDEEKRTVTFWNSGRNPKRTVTFHGGKRTVTFRPNDKRTVTKRTVTFLPNNWDDSDHMDDKRTVTFWGEDPREVCVIYHAMSVCLLWQLGTLIYDKISGRILFPDNIRTPSINASQSQSIKFASFITEKKSGAKKTFFVNQFRGRP